MVRAAFAALFFLLSGAVAAAETPVTAAQGAVLVVRSTMLTLNDALQTGQFNVLHARFSPAFRAENTVADLTIALAPLIRSRVNLSFVATTVPEIAVMEKVGANLIRVIGSCRGPAASVEFNVIYEQSHTGLAIAALKVNPKVLQAAKPPAVKNPKPEIIPDDPGWSTFTKTH